MKTMRCLPGAVEECVRRDPAAIALADGPHRFTYGELLESSDSLAKHLRMLGIRRGSVVGICFERSASFVIAALGAMKAGAAYLPLDSGYPAERLQFQLEDSGAEVLVSSESLNRSKQLVAPHVLSLERIEKSYSQSLPEDSAAAPGAEDLAYVIYTSGSTGRPKGVEITHGSLMNLIGWHRSEFGITESDRASQIASAGFDASVWEIWPYLTAGASVHFAGDWSVRDPRRLRDWLTENSITCSFVPTRLAERLFEMEWPSTSSLRVLLTGGDRLQRYPPRGLPFTVVNNYGPTECTVVATSAIVAPNPESGWPPPIGRPIANTWIHILNENREPVPDGEPGEIWIAGAGLARGYRGRPDLTAERFRPNQFENSEGPRIYWTGDRGQILPNGEVAFLGRTDLQVKVRGHRTEVEEVEGVLNEHASVRECAVVAQETLRGGTQLVAYVSLKSGRKFAAPELREFLLNRLPEPMVPASFVELTQLPITLNGKTDRGALRNLETVPLIVCASGGNDVEQVAAELPLPQESVEEQLQGMCQEILRVDEVPMNGDLFLASGGDSLQMAELITEIERRWGIALEPSVLLERRTLGGLAQAIRVGRARKKGSPLVTLKASGRLAPIFCVHSHDGSAMLFRRLPTYVSAEQPVYGFQSSALAGGALHYTVEEAAACYVEELLKAQPEGPCSIFGYCYGGLVAFVMAQRLTELGRPIAFLGMFNVPAPGSLAGWPLGQRSYLERRVGSEIMKMDRLEVSEKWAHVARNARNFGRMLARSVRIEAWRVAAKALRPSAARRVGRGLLDLEEINIAAGKDYKPHGTFPGKITYLTSEELSYPYSVAPETGWGPFVRGGVEFVRVPRAAGSHPRETMLRILAEKLGRTACDAESHELEYHDEIKGHRVVREAD